MESPAVRSAAESGKVVRNSRRCEVNRKSLEKSRLRFIRQEYVNSFTERINEIEKVIRLIDHFRAHRSEPDRYLANTETERVS